MKIGVNGNVIGKLDSPLGGFSNPWLTLLRSVVPQTPSRVRSRCISPSSLASLTSGLASGCSNRSDYPSLGLSDGRKGVGGEAQDDPAPATVRRASSRSPVTSAFAQTWPTICPPLQMNVQALLGTKAVASERLVPFNLLLLSRKQVFDVSLFSPQNRRHEEGRHRWTLYVSKHFI